MKICNIEECYNEVYIKKYGLCRTHYQRKYRYGDPNIFKSTPPSYSKRFIEKALRSDTEECIIWPFKSVTGSGYPRSCFEGKRIDVHRFVCIKYCGSPVGDKKYAAHYCGNRLCINPKHIRWATAKENTNDLFIHNRMLYGENHKNSKLKEFDVIYILKSKESSKILAEKFGVSTSTINAIKSRNAWKHINVDDL